MDRPRVLFSVGNNMIIVKYPNHHTRRHQASRHFACVLVISDAAHLIYTLGSVGPVFQLRNVIPGMKKVIRCIYHSCAGEVYTQCNRIVLPSTLDDKTVEGSAPTHTPARYYNEPSFVTVTPLQPPSLYAQNHLSPFSQPRYPSKSYNPYYHTCKDRRMQLQDRLSNSWRGGSICRNVGNDSGTYIRKTNDVLQ